jgi:hypothetical protein
MVGPVTQILNSISRWNKDIFDAELETIRQNQGDERGRKKFSIVEVSVSRENSPLSLIYVIFVHHKRRRLVQRSC